MTLECHQEDVITAGSVEGSMYARPLVRVASRSRMVLIAGLSICCRLFQMYHQRRQRARVRQSSGLVSRLCEERRYRGHIADARQRGYNERTGGERSCNC